MNEFLRYVLGIIGVFFILMSLIKMGKMAWRTDAGRTILMAFCVVVEIAAPIGIGLILINLAMNWSF